MKRKLRDRRGETMVELMVAFVLFVLALATLSVLVSVGLKLNRSAADADRKYYSDFANGGEPAIVTVKITEGAYYTSPEESVNGVRNEDGFLYFG